MKEESRGRSVEAHAEAHRQRQRWIRCMCCCWRNNYLVIYISALESSWHKRSERFTKLSNCHGPSSQNKIPCTEKGTGKLSALSSSHPIPDADLWTRQTPNERQPVNLVFGN